MNSQPHAPLAHANALRYLRSSKRSSRAHTTLALAVGLCLTGTPTWAQSDPCQAFLDQVATLRARERAEKSEWQPDPNERPVRKPNAAQIRRIEAVYRPLIQGQLNAYDQCRVAHGGKLDLAANLDGTATLTTDSPNTPGPYGGPVTVMLTFEKYQRTTVRIDRFDDVEVGPFSTPLGSNTTTISFVSLQSSTVNPTSGAMSVRIELLFHHSLAVGDSQLTITLSTEHALGARISRPGGDVILAGTSTFVGGFLGGSRGTLVVDANLSALP